MTLRQQKAVVIYPTGCKVVRIEGDDDRAIEDSLIAAITDQTAAIFTVASHRKSSLPPLPIAVEIGKARGVPVMVDAAYEIPPKENLWYYTKEVGVDAAIFSGGKALRGPSSTGLIVGRKEIVVS
ncbi:MAG: aminotransferase class V-fold PLP-dependent enzyme [Candidatus Latescibacterota bacterium]|nr:aminotransferase class V-fold PLP-dependent enzyme [Candidatus Latescibacterota bacterium]